VLSPRHNTLLCAHPGDVGSLGRNCNGGVAECVPGCTTWEDHSPGWCDETRGSAGERLQWPFYCAYPPSRLAESLEVRDNLAKGGKWYEHKMWDDGKFYDEDIFASWTFVDELPQSVEAFFYTDGQGCGDASDGPKCQDYARNAHASFLRHFGISDTQVPLLKFDLFTRDGPPFTEVAV